MGDLDGKVAIVTLEHPPVNALSQRLLEELEEVLYYYFGAGAPRLSRLELCVSTDSTPKSC